MRLQGFHLGLLNENSEVIILKWKQPWMNINLSRLALCKLDKASLVSSASMWERKLHILNATLSLLWGHYSFSYADDKDLMLIIIMKTLSIWYEIEVHGLKSTEWKNSVKIKINIKTINFHRLFFSIQTNYAIEA